MTSKPPTPYVPERPTQAQTAPSDFLNRPEFEPGVPVKKRHRVVVLLVLLLLFALLAGASFGGYHYYLARPTKATAGNIPAQGKVTDPYAGWKTYTSSSEQATFKYPSDWTVTKPYMVSNDSSNTDQIGIRSPSGGITVSWVTDLVGFGDEHTASYPLNTVIDKTPIAGASGFYVISGITTLNSTTYYPWTAVQDADGILTSGVMGNVVTFTGRRALNPTTNSVTGILFSTSAARTNQNSPALTRAQAIAWFAGAEAKQAKLILESLVDAPNQYLTIGEWNIKLPLSTSIQDAYYSVMNSGRGADGLPNTAWLSLRSLDRSGCGIEASGPSASESPVGSIIRVLPTDRDPVSNMLYTQQYPGGVTIGGYYYAFAPWRNSTCASVATLQALNTDFMTAVKGIAAAGTIIKIPELGIRITVPVSLSDITYETHMVTLRNGNPATYAIFSTKSLTALDAGCGTNFGPLGSLEVVKGQYPTFSANSPYASIDFGVLVKQFPDFYVSADWPQAMCSANSAAEGMATQDKAAFGNAEPTIQPLN